MYICVILRQGQKILAPCERNITSDTLKGLKVIYWNNISFCHVFLHEWYQNVRKVKVLLVKEPPAKLPKWKNVKCQVLKK